MVNKSHIISTLFAVVSMLSLLAAGGFNNFHAERPAGDSHGHSHLHTHGGSCHVHVANNGQEAFLAAPHTDFSHVVFAAFLTVDPYHGCCHEDHSHPAPVFVIAGNDARWDDPIPSRSSPLPDLWQPVLTAPPAVHLMPPPRHGWLRDPISQLQTVVMLT